MLPDPRPLSFDVMRSHRPATTLDDLRLASDLMSAAWLASPETAVATAAGIEWWHASSYPDALADHLSIWFDDETPVGWTWDDDGETEWHVWTGEPARDDAVFRDILTAAVERAGTAGVASWTSEEDVRSIAILDGLGFARAGRRLAQLQWQPDPAVPPAMPPLPDGYRIRTVAGPDDLDRRVAVHRAAFPTSRLNRAKYDRLTTLPHYRFEDDLVVEAPDGTFAAYAMAWWDPVASVGEFEPVGTHPDHQRRGLARALLTFGLRRYRTRGARVVQVYADADDVAPVALYEAIGFTRHAFHQRYERPAAAARPTASPDPASGVASTP